ncbi:MAG: hypothetical protein GY847_06915 [Proteobacteria bacterium]|nr:hypothetical protein [Pseudomonadota bacterium]
MQNKHRQKIALFVVSFALFTIALVYSNQPTHAQNLVKQGYKASLQVAEQGFREFLDRALTDTFRANHGLTSYKTHETVSLGAPFRLHVITPDKVAACGEQACKSADDLGTPIDTFFFPVKFNGELRLFMTVDRFKGQSHFEIGSIGYSRLAQEITTVLRKWPRTNNVSPKLYVCDQAYAYLFSIPDQSSPNLTIIDFSSPEKVSYQTRYQTLSTFEQTVSVLRQRIPPSLMEGGE